MDSNMGFSDEVMEEIGISYAGIREIRLLESEITTLNTEVRDLESQLYKAKLKWLKQRLLFSKKEAELERVNSLWFNRLYKFFSTLRLRNPFYHR